jgi:hypothetical protein
MAMKMRERTMPAAKDTVRRRPAARDRTPILAPLTANTVPTIGMSIFFDPALRLIRASEAG